MKIEELIPTGRKNAIKRSELLKMCKDAGIAFDDRSMRGLIENAKKETVILNMQDGNGYFKPCKDDLAELKHYVSQESKRGISIMKNLKMANNLLADFERGCV